MELSSVLVMAHSECCAWRGPVDERSLHQDLFVVSSALQAAMSWQPLKQDATWNRGWSLSIDVYDYTAILLLHIYRLKIPLTRIICQLLSRGYSVSGPWRLVRQVFCWRTSSCPSKEVTKITMPRSGKMVFVGFASQEVEPGPEKCKQRQVGECSMVRYRYSRGTLHPWDNEKR